MMDLLHFRRNLTSDVSRSEAAGLGSYEPAEIGPLAVQRANGVVDIEVDDEPAAIAMCKRVLALLRGSTVSWEAPRSGQAGEALLPRRHQAYDVRTVTNAILDIGSAVELSPAFGVAAVTLLGTVEGRTVGVMANNPMRAAGAIDVPAATKAAPIPRVV